MADRQQTILIVDDEPSSIEQLSSYLKEDYRILIATSGEQALKRLQASPVDLILLDIVMSDMDGYEVCRRLKGEDKYKKIPIIFTTAKSARDDESKGLQLGAVDYIIKPFYMPIVIARIKTHLELKHKTDMLEELASLDGLTKIPNRRKFDEMLKKEWRRSVRNNHPISLIMLDIDFFKNFNDHLGHAAGDECLVKVARVLFRTVSRAGDLLARYGGEEFSILLPNTDMEGASGIASNIRTVLSSLKISHPASDIADYVTVSMGIATVMTHGKTSTAKKLLDTADTMLYFSKQQGRDQVQAELVE